MDRNFGEWYREMKMPTDHDVLKRRWEGIQSFVNGLSYNGVLELSRLFYQMGPKDVEFEENFRIAFQKTDNGFRMKGNDLEIAVLAGATLARVLKKGKRYVATLAAFATICPYFRGKRHVLVIPEIPIRAREYLSSKSGTLRKLSPPKKTLSPSGQLDEWADEFVSILTGGEFTEAGDSLSAYFKKLSATLQKCVEVTNHVLKEQFLYREESDVLWWLMGEHSRDLEVPVRQLELPPACLIAGKELSDLTRVLPGPFSAPAFLYKFLHRISSDLEKPVTFSQSIKKADRKWREDWCESFADIEGVDLCPTLYAVRESLKDESEDGWHKAFESTTTVSANVSLSPLDLAIQVYEECLFVKSTKES